MPLTDAPYSIEHRDVLDDDLRREILALIDHTTALDGHPPVGEHKLAHLTAGAIGWDGILVREEAAPDRAGALVGYAHLRWSSGTAPRAAVEVVVRPDQRQAQIAEALLAATRDVVARAGGGLLWLWVHRVDDATQTLPARLGWSVQRELAFMERSLQTRPAASAAPPGVTIRPFRPGKDDDALLAVNNAAFGDHPEQGGWDAAELADRLTRDWFDAEGVRCAWRSDELVGFHWTKWHGHDGDAVVAHEPVGEVYVLAISPDAQGLGLGRVLLEEGLAHLHDRGCRHAILYVDSAATGAVKLYTSAGFTLSFHEVCYEIDVPPAPGTSASDLRRPAAY